VCAVQIVIEFPQEDDPKSIAGQSESLSEIRVWVPDPTPEVAAANAAAAAAAAAAASALKAEGEDGEEKKGEEDEDAGETIEEETPAQVRRIVHRLAVRDRMTSA
jgi:hypothetical protein